jgi:hypothetical protein
LSDNGPFLQFKRGQFCSDRRRLSRLCGGGSTCFGIGLLNRRAHNLQALADEVIE